MDIRGDASAALAGGGLRVRGGEDHLVAVGASIDRRRGVEHRVRRQRDVDQHVGAAVLHDLEDTERLTPLRPGTHVVDGRFKGGHITRHYGRPDKGIHTVQLEMCWSCYMAEQPPFELDPRRTARLSPVLQALVHTMLRWTPHG